MGCKGHNFGGDIKRMAALMKGVYLMYLGWDRYLSNDDESQIIMRKSSY